MDFKMDVFNEQLIKVKKSFLKAFSQVLLIFLAIVISPFTFVIPNFGQIITPLIWFGVYYVMRFYNVEYEYSLTNGELDIDKIYSQRKRVHVLSVKCKQFEIVAPINTTTFKNRLEDKNIDKKIDVSSRGNPDKSYFAIFREENQRILLIFEPTEKMLNSIKLYIPRRVVNE